MSKDIESACLGVMCKLLMEAVTAKTRSWIATMQNRMGHVVGPMRSSKRLGIL